jgi:hypothetical protein
MRRQPIAYSMLAIFLTLLVTVPSGYWYTNHVQHEAAAEQAELRRESDRRWCELLVTLDTAYQAAPPATALGRQVAAAMHRLRAEFGC